MPDLKYKLLLFVGSEAIELERKDNFELMTHQLTLSNVKETSKTSKPTGR